MSDMWPANKAIYHLLSVALFLIMLITCIISFTSNESHTTFKVMIFFIWCISVVASIVTGISLKKSKM